MTYRDVIHVRGDYRLVLIQDEDAESPRTAYDEASHAITVQPPGGGGRYLTIDEDAGPLAEGWDRLWDRHGWDDAVRIFTRWAETFYGAVVVAETPYDGAWAVWYMTGAEVTETGTTDALALIKGERDTYRAWAEGDCWGYVIERRITWHTGDCGRTMETWEEAGEFTGSCWGIYGREDAETMGRAELDAWEPVSDDGSLGYYDREAAERDGEYALADHVRLAKIEAEDRAEEAGK